LGSLSARCSILASANPASGHYNRARSILDNIRVSNAILSRFDLVFLLLDEPDLKRDWKLSEHVMKLHSRNRKRKLDEFNQFADNNRPAYSCSLNDDLASSLPRLNNVKRLRTNTSYSQTSEDDQLPLNPMTQADMMNYPSLTARIKSMCE